MVPNVNTSTFAYVNMSTFAGAALRADDAGALKDIISLARTQALALQVPSRLDTRVLNMWDC